MSVPIVKHKSGEIKLPESEVKFVPKPNFRWLVCGSSGSGKTNLVRHMLKDKRLLPSIFDIEKHVFVMCPTADMSNDFEFLPEQNVFPMYDELLVKEIVDTQKANIKQFGKRRTPPVLLILDDCLEYVHNYSYINQIITKIRHYNISLIILSQKLKGIGRTIRLNSDYITIFRTSNLSEIENVLDEFVGKKFKKDLLDQVIEHFKTPYTFLHIDLKTQDYTLRFWKSIDEQFNTIWKEKDLLNINK